MRPPTKPPCSFLLISVNVRGQDPRKQALSFLWGSLLPVLLLFIHQLISSWFSESNLNSRAIVHPQTNKNKISCVTNCWVSPACKSHAFLGAARQTPGAPTRPLKKVYSWLALPGGTGTPSARSPVGGCDCFARTDVSMISAARETARLVGSGSLGKDGS